MASTKMETEKFTGRNDFGLWRIKMRAILVQQGLADALKPETKQAALDEADDKSAIKKQEMLELAHSAIILCLGDKVLREVAKEKSAADVWSKLESLYMTKYLANRLFMKQKLYSYKIHDEKGIEEQLEEFNKAVDDLENIDVSLDDEDKAILLLNALPKSFDHLRDAMLYGREKTITLEEVQSVLKAKQLQKSTNKAVDSTTEALNISKFKGKKGSQKGKQPKPKNQKAKDPQRKETRECFYCKKPGHLKKNCYSWKKKMAEEQGSADEADVAVDMETPQVMNTVERDVGNSWIMDSGCSFHMSPHKEWFINLSKCEGSVLLGNNQICPVKGIGEVKIINEDGSSVILTEVRYISSVKRNLISLGILETKGCMFKSEKGNMVVSKDGKKLMEATRIHSLYYLLGEARVSSQVNVASSDDFV